MENSIRLAVEIIFTETGKTPTENDQKAIAEKVLNALMLSVEAGSGLAPNFSVSNYTPAHIYVTDYLTGGREIKCIHSF